MPAAEGPRGRAEPPPAPLSQPPERSPVRELPEPSAGGVGEGFPLPGREPPSARAWGGISPLGHHEPSHHELDHAYGFTPEWDPLLTRRPRNLEPVGRVADAPRAPEAPSSGGPRFVSIGEPHPLPAPERAPREDRPRGHDRDGRARGHGAERGHGPDRGPASERSPAVERGHAPERAPAPERGAPERGHDRRAEERPGRDARPGARPPEPRPARFDEVPATPRAEPARHKGERRDRDRQPIDRAAPPAPAQAAPAPAVPAAPPSAPAAPAASSFAAGILPGVAAPAPSSAPAAAASSGDEQRDATKDGHLERGHGRLPEGFAKLGVKEPLLRALRHAGFEAPTEIQEAAIPEALSGKDVVGQAKTGTGKTAAFGLSTLQRILNGEVKRAIVLTPTRELCVQVRDELERFSSYSRLRTVAIYGGVPLEGQRRAVAEGREFVVGTPGRVLDLAKRGWLELGDIEVVILDECDRMFDLGFRPDIEKIMRLLRAKQQLLLFSATITPDVERLCELFAKDPVKISTIPEKLTVDNVEQRFVTVAKDRKRTVLIELIKRYQPKQAIVFVRTRIGCEKLARALEDHGVRCAELHGDLRQERREKILERFREEKISLLCATDVAARGLDISTITHVFNYDIPECAEDYVHRIGRTARMGRTGQAVTLVEPGQGGLLTEIEKLTNVLVSEERLEGIDVGSMAVLDKTGAPIVKKPRQTGTGVVLFSTWGTGS